MHVWGHFLHIPRIRSLTNSYDKTICNITIIDTMHAWRSHLSKWPLTLSSSAYITRTYIISSTTTIRLEQETYKTKLCKNVSIWNRRKRIQGIVVRCRACRLCMERTARVRGYSKFGKRSEASIASFVTALVGLGALKTPWLLHLQEPYIIFSFLFFLL